MGDFPALLLLLTLTGPCLAREEPESVTTVQGSSLSTTCYYDKHKYSQEKKFWCKLLPDEECHDRVLSFPARGTNYLSIAPTRRVSLTDSGTGWLSVSMTELRVEDSGTYLCGVSDHRRWIPLKKMKVAVSYEAPAMFYVEEGDSISLNCSYSAMDNSKRSKNFAWCKMVTSTRCHPVISVEFYQIVNTQGRTRIRIDRRNKVVIVMLAELQLRDSGEYHCESHLQGNTILLKMITLNVLEKNVYYDTVNEATSPPSKEWRTIHPTVPSNEDQRTLYVVLALGSLLAVSALIATISLMAIIFTKRRKRGNVLNFGGHPNCRLAAQQTDERNPRDAAPDGEVKNGIIYAMSRLQPKPKADDVTYANLEPSPKSEVIRHSAEPSAVLFSSGTVEYATIIFGDSSPQFGTKEKQISPN